MALGKRLPLRAKNIAAIGKRAFMLTSGCVLHGQLRNARISRGCAHESEKRASCRSRAEDVPVNYSGFAWFTASGGLGVFAILLRPITAKRAATAAITRRKATALRHVGASRK